MRLLRLVLDSALLSPSTAASQGVVLNVQYLPDGTVMELSAVEGDLEAILSQLEDAQETEAFDHLGTSGARHYIFQYGRPHAEVRALIDLLEKHRLMIALPIRFDSTTEATVDVLGTFDALKSAYDTFSPEMKRRTSIEHIGEYTPARLGIRSVLTERQREVLDAAVATGYYATPRTATAEDVANRVGCAPSTASEHLRKLEARTFGQLTTADSS
ncbi:helix-turn-helix domain-containing protein [Halomarina rubra]|uniref:Helix-turn-helix domain-containing protein n=1 Tax=Halomarina rubra TaxID=2071873 RepID=A0ABD6AXS1_9EURY|nr:helix-turn-helix domain-containing protein [Halomarina rubra]